MPKFSVSRDSFEKRYLREELGLIRPAFDHRKMEQTYCHWIKRFILFNNVRHPQELLGHKDVKTTMIYTRVLNRGGKGVKSPVDDL